MTLRLHKQPPNFFPCSKQRNFYLSEMRVLSILDPFAGHPLASLAFHSFPTLLRETKVFGSVWPIVCFFHVLFKFWIPTSTCWPFMLRHLSKAASVWPFGPWEEYNRVKLKSHFTPFLCLCFLLLPIAYYHFYTFYKQNFIIIPHITTQSKQ